LAIINDLDLKAECASLSSAERVWLRESNEKLTSFRRVEQTK
jgi:hypothetical protein